MGSVDSDEWLGRQMARRGVTARQIADALDVTPNTVYGWLKGKIVISEERVPRLAEVLDVSELEARRGLGFWVPTDAGPEQGSELDKDRVRQALRRFRDAADELDRILDDTPG